MEVKLRSVGARHEATMPLYTHTKNQELVIKLEKAKTGEFFTILLLDSWMWLVLSTPFVLYEPINYFLFQPV